MNKLKRYITLKIEGDRINANKLRNSISNFYEFIDEIACQVFKRKKPIKWIVEVKEGSINLVNEAEVDEKLDNTMQDKVFRLIGSGIDILNKEAIIPPNFNDKALLHLQDLASIPDIEKNGLQRIDILIDNKRFTLSKLVVANIDLLLGVKFKALGSIEGRLSTLSERGTKRFIIYDSLTDKGINCYIDDNGILYEAANAFGMRVNVYGTIRYDYMGNPKSIKVESLKVFKDSQDLPTAFDVLGILRR